MICLLIFDKANGEAMGIRFSGCLFLIFLCQVAQSSPAWLEQSCAGCSPEMERQTGVFILDRGVDSLLAENSWEIGAEFNPDDQVGWLKRLKL